MTATTTLEKPSPPTSAAVPPPLPPGRVEPVPGVGEMFVRDTGTAPGQRGVVLLLHGWLFPADLNWFTCYGALSAAGYRVLAVDHRGHGRGLRSEAPFRITDCAADAAALLRHLGTGPAIVVGYSMGGAIAQAMAHDHPDVVAGLVLCATGPGEKARPRPLSAVWLRASKLALQLMPRRLWRWSLRTVSDPQLKSWMLGELTRLAVYDGTEAGRELGRFSSREWLPQLDVPAAVVCTTADRSVKPSVQRELAALIPGATLHEVPVDHLGVVARADLFVPVLVSAIKEVTRQ